MIKCNPVRCTAYYVLLLAFVLLEDYSYRVHQRLLLKYYHRTVPI